MKILLLGGSSFLGRAFASEALARGDEVTTFNRGRPGTDLPGVQAVRGERDSAADLARLVEGRHWDAVVDTSAQQPAQVALSAGLLREHAGHYTFVSSVHAFADWPARTVDETSPLHPCPADTPPGQPFSNALKAGCGRAALERTAQRRPRGIRTGRCNWRTPMPRAERAARVARCPASRRPRGSDCWPSCPKANAGDFVVGVSLVVVWRGWGRSSRLRMSGYRT
ncbi:NAD-dependent epimerase/dehydratase family protein, partial [Kitasatospora sp. NPDC088548]|uniref:NAD-dependent epimerase/dehydratase family protein n=1 Tax=Kitasatospora sp. NPDC088548 TaxID=3364075 RepID=UPI0038256E73